MGCLAHNLDHVKKRIRRIEGIMLAVGIPRTLSRYVQDETSCRKRFGKRKNLVGLLELYQAHKPVGMASQARFQPV